MELKIQSQFRLISICPIDENITNIVSFFATSLVLSI